MSTLIKVLLYGGFVECFPNQEPCVRDFTTRCDGRMSSRNLLHTALDQGNTQTNPPYKRTLINVLMGKNIAWQYSCIKVLVLSYRCFLRALRYMSALQLRAFTIFVLHECFVTSTLIPESFTILSQFVFYISFTIQFFRSTCTWEISVCEHFHQCVPKQICIQPLGSTC